MRVSFKRILSVCPIVGIIENRPKDFNHRYGSMVYILEECKLEHQTKSQFFFKGGYLGSLDAETKCYSIDFFNGRPGRVSKIQTYTPFYCFEQIYTAQEALQIATCMKSKKFSIIQFPYYFKDKTSEILSEIVEMNPEWLI